MIPYSSDQIAKAKAEGLHLVRIEINGRHAKTYTAEFAGPVGPETAAKIIAFFDALIADTEGRLK